jgi:heptosyltransferase-2
VTDQLSGPYLSSDGVGAYTDDVAPWFDMGLLSVHGKQRADELKVLNTKSHPQIYAEMLGIPMGKPGLVLGPEEKARAEAFLARHRSKGRPFIGLNTGAGGRWASKQLSVERTVEVARLVARDMDGAVGYLVLGGPAEAERNGAIVAGLAAAGLHGVDGGSDNALPDFAALVGGCQALVASDSLALHIAIALDVPVVAFFAPTSAAEIELYGLGEKVVSTAPDYCSYRSDTDTSTLTPERIAPCVLRQLAVRHG